MSNVHNTGRDRLAQLQRDQARKGKNRNAAMIGGGLVAALALAGGGWYLASKSDSASGTGDLKAVKTWKDLSREHVNGNPTFEMTPPVGGAHNAAWANCGTYDKPVPDKYAVHSLEHGAVWITYSDKASAGDIAKLKDMAKQDYILMSPYPKQDTPIALSAWGTQLKVNSASDKDVEAFIKKYRQGPQTPEPGASCTGAYDPNTGLIAGTMRPPS